MDSEEQKLKRMQILLAALCVDADVGIDLGKGWSYNPVGRQFTIDARDLSRYGADYCAGVLAHEIGHFFVSRYPLFIDRLLPRAASAHLLNSLEDPRSDLWIARRYPGVGRWLQLVDGDPQEWDVSRDGLYPRFMQFTMNCLRDPALGWKAEGTGDRLVREALLATRTARREYMHRLPPASLTVDLSSHELQGRVVTTVLPLLDSTKSDAGSVWRSQWEALAMLRAAEAMVLAAEEILPKAAELLALDRELIGRYLAAHSREAEQVERKLSPKHLDRQYLLQVAQAALAAETEVAGRRGGVPEPLQRLAGRLLEVLMARLEKTPEATPQLGPAGKPEPSQKSYEDYLLEVRSQVETLVRHIRDALPPRLATRYRGGHASGPRPDLKQLMAFEADPRRYDRLWQRKERSDRIDAAVLLLIDLSGSMRGEKIDAAVTGTVLLTETLEQLGVCFAIYGFQDVLVPIKNFSGLVDPVVKQAISEMTLEVAGERPGGNNDYGHNDDGPCLLEAAEELLCQPERDQVLLVISDGLPEGRRSDKKDLERAVASILEHDRDVKLIGVGLGPHTEHVRQFYPESIANIPVKRFAHELGVILCRIMAGAGRS